MFRLLPEMRCREICLDCRFKSNARNADTLFCTKIYIISIASLPYNLFYIRLWDSYTRSFQFCKYAIYLNVALLVTIPFISKHRLFNHITCNACYFGTCLCTSKLI